MPAESRASETRVAAEVSRLLGVVAELAVQLFEEGLAVLVVLFIGLNLLQIPLGEVVELVLNLLDVHVVVALDRLATRRHLFAGCFGGLRILDELLAPFRALALGSLRCFSLIGTELLPGLFRQVTFRLATFASPRATLLRLPLFLGPLLQVLLVLVLLALVAAAGLLVLLSQELRLAGRPLPGLAALVRGLDLLLDPLPKLGVRVLLFSLRRLYVSTELPLRCLTGNWTCDTGDSRTPVR